MNVSKEGEKFLIDMKVYLLTKGIKEEDIKSFRVEERNYSYKFMMIFQHIGRCYAEYKMTCTRFLILF